MQACGSGGTTAGIALGNHLSQYGAKIWAYGVCDDPDYFYEYIDGIFKDLGVPSGQISPVLTQKIGRTMLLQLTRVPFACAPSSLLSSKFRLPSQSDPGACKFGANATDECPSHGTGGTHLRKRTNFADVKASKLLTAVQAKGAGYAISQSQELEVVKEVAESSGRLFTLQFTVIRGRKRPNRTSYVISAFWLVSCKRCI